MDRDSTDIEGSKEFNATLAENLSIMLVEPTGAGNIGSVARVMHNTGLKRLVLVNPVEFENDEGFQMACNAGHLLLQAKVYDTFAEAIRDENILIGSTRRKGKLRNPHFSLGDIIPKVGELTPANRVALVFGREAHGLNNEELELCDMLFEIPTHEDNPSLNLSHAVFAVTHAIFMSKTQVGESIELAPRAQVEMLFDHLDKTLYRIGYGIEGSEYLKESIMHNFRRLFGRTGLMEN
ncbi:MAG: RNA methyltransferase [Proteobacteria bacterium]|nr:RNA methyltransferase [Pseudomonadota bacterium]